MNRLVLASLLAFASTGCTLEVGVGRDLPDDEPTDWRPVDFDGDGFSTSDGDCDDLEPAVGPSDAFDEVCDGLDNNCDGSPDSDEVCVRHEVFDQSLQLDLLLVVDTREGSAGLRDRLRAASEDLLAPLIGPGLDVHIGVVSTDMTDVAEQGRLREALGNTFLTADVSLDVATGWFHEVTTTTPESNDPRSRDALVAALFDRAETDNRMFRRSDAALDVIMVALGPDKSQQSSLPELLALLASMEGTLERTSVHSVAEIDEVDCDNKVWPAAPGRAYSALTLATGGTELSACERDLGPFLSSLAQQVALDGLNTRFDLRNVARLGSVEVVATYPGGMTRSLLDEEFALAPDGRALVFTNPPPAGTHVEVTYLLDLASQ